MPRRPRFVLAGAPHHITQRGNNRQDVFFSDQDRTRYLQLLHIQSQRHGLRILGWCLMTNHVHLVAIPQHDDSLALAIGQAHSQYSLELNRQQHRAGHLWQNRFFSCPLEPSHLLAALHYVDLNPVRAGLTGKACDWPWSSARPHGSSGVQHELLDWPWIEWMDERRLGTWNHEDWNGCLEWTVSSHAAERIRRATRLGEPLGSQEFVNQLEATAGRPLRVGPRGRSPIVVSAFARAAHQESLFGR
jgi:putative transposase